MRLQGRIVIGNLIIVGVGFFLLLSWIICDLEPEYRKVTEEPLIDSARILSSIAASTARDGKIDVGIFRDAFQGVYSGSFSAKVYDYIKQDVDFRVYITDASGIVLFNSYDRSSVGEDYSNWLDVGLTLKGEYGARTSYDNPDDAASSVMYVAAPIFIHGELAGVISVGKPTLAASRFAADAKRKIVLGGIIVCLLVVMLGMFLSGMITRPMQRLTEYAREVRDGKRGELPPLGSSEVGELGEAFEEMRDALEGKNYVENYVQTLTHEVKSPLSAIQGATELLKEKMEMPPERRARFLGNIEDEAGRIKAVVEKLLLLSALESRKRIHDIEPLSLNDIVYDVKESFMPQLEEKRLALRISGDNKCVFSGDRFLVRHAVSNLFQNAVEFSSEGGEIEIALSKKDDGYVVLTVKDSGAGIPDYAIERVFERFYSLKRPDTGKKSSGLGLSLVREVALLHKGSAVLENSDDGGVLATLTLPVAYG